MQAEDLTICTTLRWHRIPNSLSRGIERNTNKIGTFFFIFLLAHLNFYFLFSH